MLQITEKERTDILDRVTSYLVKDLTLKHADEMQLITPAQAAGLLDVIPGTLAKMDIPRIDLCGNGRVIRYRLSEVNEYLKNQTINQ